MKAGIWTGILIRNMKPAGSLVCCYYIFVIHQSQTNTANQRTSLLGAVACSSKVTFVFCFGDPMDSGLELMDEFLIQCNLGYKSFWMFLEQNVRETNLFRTSRILAMTQDQHNVAKKTFVRRCFGIWCVCVCVKCQILSKFPISFCWSQVENCTFRGVLNL